MALPDTHGWLTLRARAAIPLAAVIAAGGVGVVAIIEGLRGGSRLSSTASVRVVTARAAQVPQESSSHACFVRSPVDQRGDVLERVRAARTPELERKILETARTAVERVILPGGRTGPDSTSDGTSGVSSDRGLAENSLDDPVYESILGRPAGVFVSLILDGKVRGCMGTVFPMETSLIREVASAARMAATSDPRQPPIAPEEVPRLDYCVSVVGRLRRHDPGAPIDPRTHGVVLTADGRNGIILPGEARTASYEIAWAKREAGVGPGDRFELLVFETERFGNALPLRR